ncbi:PEPxxWA-CTERM sorting domain-containing protein [Sphingomonas sp. TREG-RG-20F-R18-01]|uniref:PEPxxWA-CTERM sorting domain-containing protein n=1 Tax=Sphingomonas sp. TREG-RG-20F-R18-01 TaxID=2914982 RepID=UPI001F5698D9|nr:PEPxxWA-CTERM sorting domain-containing protein [Sphingomonas sp. TREG-RG-20F-R18-01]
MSQGILLRLNIALIAVTASLAPVSVASAQVTTFATFSSLNSQKDVRLINSGTAATRTEDARLFTSNSPSSTTVGSTQVKFSFLQSDLSPFVNGVVANFTLDAKVDKGAPATTIGSVIVQPIVSGSMTFISANDITVTGPNFATHTYLAGSNLLTVTFDGFMSGGKNGSQTTLGGSTEADNTVSFTSDFLDFSDVSSGDLSASFTALTTKLGLGANNSLATFSATGGGQFSADPAPKIIGLVPEPASWIMMVAGFAMLGVALRRPVPLRLRSR